MAPKRAKAKARAKAPAMRVGVLRRPAALVRLRPAARVMAAGSLWDQGKAVHLHQVEPGKLCPGALLAVLEGDYFGAAAKLAGEIQKVEQDRDSTYLMVKPMGTDNEAILKIATGSPGQLFKVHLCPNHCGLQESGDHFLHGVKGMKWNVDTAEDWMKNLMRVEPVHPGMDELAGLRRRAEGLGGEAQEVPDVAQDEKKDKKKREESSSSPTRKKKKKKKKKKEKEKAKKEEEKIAEGRLPRRAGIKTMESLFQGTALDPKEKVRRRVMKRARDFVSNKKSKKEESSSSEENTDSEGSQEVAEHDTMEGVFTEDTRPRMVAERFPGSLAAEAIMTMRRSLLTSSGELGEEAAPGPVALLYYRSLLSRRAQGAQGRELLNLATAIDALLRGRPAQCLDVLLQRMKAQEAIVHGTPWMIAQRMELVGNEQALIAGRSEMKSVQKENQEDAKTRWPSQGGSGKTGQDKGGNKGGKKDGKGAGNKGDKNKGKGEKKD